MIQILEASTNPIYRPDNEYCRRLLKEKHLSLIGQRRESEGIGISLDNTETPYSAILYEIEQARKKFEVEERLCATICSKFAVVSEEYELKTSSIWRGIMPFLKNFKSSKEYQTARTSPVTNILSDIWVHCSVGFPGRIININRIHRSFTFDITSTDPVEDFISVEPSKEILGEQLKSLTQLSPEIFEFCTQHGLLKYLLVAVDLIRESFALIDEPKIYPEKDPEIKEDWLVLEITIQGEVNEILDSYDKYTDKWVTLVPWPERNRIRVVYNII